MKKKSKNGVNSGNTFRHGSRKQLARYNSKNQHCILKSVKNRERFGADAAQKNQKVVDQVWSLFSDGGLVAEEVVQHLRPWNHGINVYNMEYTLNKRKRWLLPSMIKESIHQLKDLNDIELQTDGSNIAVKPEHQTGTQLSLAERELSHTDGNHYYYERRRKNTCTSYHDSTSQITSVLPKQKYSFETDLCKKGKCQDEDDFTKSNRAKRAVKRRLKHNQHFRGVQRKNTTGKKTSPTRANPAVPWWILDAHNPRDAHTPGAEDQANNQAPNLEDQPRVHYEVCRPGKMNGSKMFYDTSHICKFDYVYGCHRKAIKKTKHIYSTQIRDERWLIREDLEIYERGKMEFPDSLSDCSIEEDSCTESYDTRDQPTQRFSLGEAICQHHRGNEKNQKRNKCKKNTKPIEENIPCRKRLYSHPNTAMAECQVAIHPKGSQIFIDSSSDASSQVSESFEEVSMETASEFDLAEVTSPSISPLRRTLEPVLVSLGREDIGVESLQSSLHGSYMECGTVPRIFIVNLLESLTSTSVKLGGAASFKPLYLIFEENKDKGDDPSAKLFRLHVEGDLDIDRLEEVQNSLLLISENPSSVRRVVSIITEWICSNDHIVSLLMNRQIDNERICKRSAGLNLIKELQKCEISTYTTDMAYDMLGINEQHKQTEDKVDEHDASFVVIPSKFSFQGYLRTLSHIQHHDYCDICYDSLVTMVTFEDGRVETESELDGLSLAVCQHWFCKSCWQQHLFERIRLGDVKIKCPAFECDEPVSTTTCLALLPHELYQTHISHIGDHLLESSTHWKWCPNNKCGRVAKLQSHTGADEAAQASVTCGCGALWCFSCQQEAHWPSTCNQATAYFKMAKQNDAGQREVPNDVFFVQVKKCPFCRHPIEKNGGCQHMICTKCKGHFCWECLGPWSDHGFTLTCPKARAGEMTMEIDFESDIMLDQFYMEKALELRRRRRVVQFAWKHLACIALRDRILQIRRENRGFRIKSQDYWQLMSKPCESFHDAWNFMHEGMYLMEHTYVILSKSPRKKRRRGVLETSQRLEFIVEALYKMLSLDSKHTTVTLEEKLFAYVHHGKSSAQDLIQKLTPLRKRKDSH